MIVNLILSYFHKHTEPICRYNIILSSSVITQGGGNLRDTPLDKKIFRKCNAINFLACHKNLFFVITKLLTPKQFTRTPLYKTSSQLRWNRPSNRILTDDCKCGFLLGEHSGEDELVMRNNEDRYLVEIGSS